MASVQSFFIKSLSLSILLFHLGCFVFTSKIHVHHQHHHRSSKKHRVISYLKKIFSPKSINSPANNEAHSPSPTLSSTGSSHNSLISVIETENLSLTNHPRRKPSISQDSDISSDHHFFPLRNDIFPCTTCGEIFPKPQSLELHQSIKHVVSELIDGDSGKNIVQIIFKTGWTEIQKTPKIHRILKIHNSSKILSRFEEYRELVKSKAARNGTISRRDERCIADGNELLRFHCTTFLCDLGLHGNSSICNQQYCSICGIIKSGFSMKLDGISTLSNSLRAHEMIPDDIEDEFRFMNVKRAMLVCRVVAGRIGSDSDESEKEDGGFDSVMGRGLTEKDELLVFNPRAVLPCFVIVYSL